MGNNSVSSKIGDGGKDKFLNGMDIFSKKQAIINKNNNENNNLKYIDLHL
jgi:hypothetical protein